MRLSSVLWWASPALTVVGAGLWVGLYTELPFAAGALCVAVGAALAGWGAFVSPRREVPQASWELGGIAGACAAASAGVASALSPELRVAAGIVALGAAVSLPRGDGWKRAGAGILASGLLALVLVAATGLYVRFAATYHEAPVLGALVGWIARALGLGTAKVGAELILPVGSRFVPVVASWDQFGLIYGILAVVGLPGFAFLTQGAHRMCRLTARMLGIAALYLLIRHVGLLLVALRLGRPDVFWNPPVALGTIAPLLLLLFRFSGIRAGWNVTPPWPPAGASVRRQVAGASLTALGTLLLSLSLLLAPAGRESGGRVLFDESHGAWETTAKEMDTEWYGMASTYNYESLFHWLDGYYEVDRLFERIDHATLARGDILILKTPSIPYTSEEKAAIVTHVRRGGGLFVVGDHTNVFGTTSVLNPVLAPFGLRLGYDATYRLHDGGFTVYEPRGSIDPVFQHVGRFDFLTSCTVHGGPFALPFIHDSCLLAHTADCSTRNFFPADRFALTSTFGAFLQAAGVDVGRGRVVVFTDSTCFSNFSLHMDGYTGFLLGVMEYLRRENPLPGWRPIATSIGGLLAVIGLALGVSNGRRAVALTLVCVLLGWGVAVTVSGAYHRSAYPVPAPRRDVPYVYFDTSASFARIAAQPSMSDPLGARGAFGTFFTWTQRIGLVPVLVSAQTPLVAGRPYVVLNPARGPDPSQGRIVKYVKSHGGSLVLLGDPRRDREALDAYCALFGFSLVTTQSGSLVLAGGTITQTEISPAQTISTSVARAGAGRVVVVSDSVAFSDLALGGGFAVPSIIQRRLYDLEFWLFGTLLASPP